MALPRKLLNEDEEPILDLHPHWWFFVPHLAALLASLVVGFAAYAAVDEDVVLIAAALLILGCLIAFGARYSNWATTHFVVTNHRVIHREGVVHKKGSSIPLDRVNTVDFSQKLFERLLGMGDLLIESAGTDGQSSFDDIRKPGEVKKEIFVQKDDMENRRFNRMAAASAAAGPAEASIPTQIRELDELRKQGVLSEEEFAEKKQALLDRM